MGSICTKSNAKEGDGRDKHHKNKSKIKQKQRASKGGDPRDFYKQERK